MGKTVKGFEITNEDLEQINRFTKRELMGDEIYSFSVVLCDNDIDRDYEQFDVNTLEQVAVAFVGKTGIFDHDAKGKNQASRIYSAEVVVEPTQKNSLGEPYTFVKAKAYMIKGAGNDDLILEIDGGIKKEVSVSCRVKSVFCSVCGTDLKKSSCSHKKGRTYNKSECHHILSGILDAYEWSFVAIPAQKNAGVTKAFGETIGGLHMNERGFEQIKKAFAEANNECVTLSSSEVSTLLASIDAFQKSAQLGEIYRNDLICEVKRLAFLVNETMPAVVINSVACKMDIDELKAFKLAYEQKLEKAENNVQLKSQQDERTTQTNQFKM